MEILCSPAKIKIKIIAVSNNVVKKGGIQVMCSIIQPSGNFWDVGSCSGSGGGKGVHWN